MDPKSVETICNTVLALACINALVGLFAIPLWLMSRDE